MDMPHAVHPRGAKATILFTSVFGPYAQDDAYGSRAINPMELYHNQVTRVQGPLSLRMFHRSFGLKMIETNIDAPCTILDFPSMNRFIDELQTHSYDIVGITAISPNYLKVKKMCELVRAYQPQATIVVGGHIANKPDVHSIIDADYIVKGEGIRWFRKFIGQDEKAPIKHPLTISGFGTRSFGITFPERPGETAAVLIPSVGCPMGCNFCSTSALFGGKGNFISFYEGGDDLYSVICELEEKLKVRSFFVMDENFLFHKKRALRLLELMEQNNKSWTFYVFSSAGVLKSYTMDQLVSLGISWVWMGLEGENSQYTKLHGVDTRLLIKNLQDHGIGVLGSTIIGLENHTPDNIDPHINYAVSHDTDFHQFMLYTPVPGTPLYEQYKQEGVLLAEDEFSVADSHGQYRFNYRHKYIPQGEENGFLLKAFQRDFEINGPSLARMIRTELRGWLKYKNHPDQRIRSRFQWESKGLSSTSAGAIWGMRKWYKKNTLLHEKINTTLQDLYREFGLKARLIAPIIGSIVHLSMKKEAQRLASGWTYEPPIIYEKNEKALALEKAQKAFAGIKVPRLETASESIIPTFAFISRFKAQYYAFQNARSVKSKEPRRP
ncbi:MAG: cobalamin-dependent protein, partial [Pseudomonadota bacterium]